ncbi:hypothetical protein M514_20076 [Trichuris suis]|uniref:Uncharacterized protein n=1 Tax=Trichuris suis TaxID=68888 RepID=A0A085NE85_9BILA|nr:hypothetical protein M514_20076 [Trichuris suis]
MECKEKSAREICAYENSTVITANRTSDLKEQCTVQNGPTDYITAQSSTVRHPNSFFRHCHPVRKLLRCKANKGSDGASCMTGWEEVLRVDVSAYLGEAMKYDKMRTSPMAAAAAQPCSRRFALLPIFMKFRATCATAVTVLRLLFERCGRPVVAGWGPVVVC